MKQPHFKKAVIAGIGLMGGSLGLAMKQAGLADQVVGLARRERTLREAKAKQCIDQGTLSAAEAAQGADLVVLCGPVRSTPALLEALLPFCSSRCLITDVGSTKTEVLQQAGRILEKFRKHHPARKDGRVFIGSHPMAGSEKAGVLAARPDLYRGSLCLLVREKSTPRRALADLGKFWKAVGCSRVEILSPQAHDRLSARVSHLPHALAVCLVGQLADWNRQDPRACRVAASGFRDTTRIAAGLPDMWTDIMLSNRKEVVRAIRVFEKKLARMKRLIGQNQERALRLELERASQFRIKMENEKHGC